MKLTTLVPIFCALAALPLCSYGQESSQNEVEKLKALLAEQQRQIEALRQAVTQQQKTIEGMQQKSAAQAAAAPALTAPPPTRPLIASTTPMAVPGASNPSPKFEPPLPQPEATSPLQLKIGDVSIIPIGFLDATAVWRDKNSASGIGTNFAAIPYSNTAAGNLSEFRFSPQNSRIGFRMDVNVHGAHTMLYNENDFLGTSGANNIGVTNGAFVPRIRLFWVDVRKDQWEILGGQSWSMLTPNRKAISPLPGDIFYSQVFDVNYLIGLTWDRQPGFRVLYHPNSQVTAGLSFEQPNQYIGGSSGAPMVTLPAALTGLAATQFDSAANVLNTPNLHPDIIAKLAFDPNSKLHFEVAGIERTFKDYIQSTNQHFTKAAGGGSANINFEITKGVRVISNNHWGVGTGRYLFGTAPDLIVRANGSISPIHDHSTTDGIEATIKNTLFYVYYGGMFIGHNTAIDANGTSLIGYGYVGSPGSHNQSIEEATIGLNQTVWKDAKWGAINWMLQYQYTFRSPWFVANNQPGIAHDNALYFDLRYTLPGAPPPAK